MGKGSAASVEVYIGTTVSHFLPQEISPTFFRSIDVYENGALSLSQ